MANATFTKGSAVEVSSDEPGFHGAWYAATVVDQVEASSNGYLVKYNVLFEDDRFLRSLTEVVDPSFLRPLPPSNVRRNNGSSAKDSEAVDGDGDVGGDFEVYDVVDAYHRDGWWVSVVKKVISEGEFVVSFQNPTEEFVFERSKLRFHVDWIGCRWLVPPKKTAGEELQLSDKNAGLSKGALITDGPPLRSVSSNSSMDGSLTYSRKRFQSLAGSKGNTKVIASVLETNGSHQDSPPVEHTKIITNTVTSFFSTLDCDSLTHKRLIRHFCKQQTSEAGDGKSHRRRKRGKPQKFVVTKPIGLLEDGHEVTTDIDEQSLSALKRSSCFSPENQTSVTSGAGTHTDYQQNWPFIKQSPLWVAIESYLTPSQKPHFSPLKKIRMEYREGSAIGHIVTYGNLVKMVSDESLHLNDPVDIINTRLETLCVLETHGFDVGSIRSRLKELLSLKSKVCEHKNKRRVVENELEICNHEKSLVEEEREELELKMQVLKEKIVQNAPMRKAKEEEIGRLQSKFDLVSNQINDWEDAFGKLVGSPL